MDMHGFAPLGIEKQIFFLNLETMGITYKSIRLQLYHNMIRPSAGVLNIVNIIDEDNMSDLVTIA